MSAYRRNNKGFTLVEILIVVIILGILAEIVIPQFTNASTDAKKNSLTSQLQTIRSQIELYKLQHNGGYPPFASFATVMTSKTNADHTTTGTPQLGPYMQAIPANPFCTSATPNAVVATAAQAATSAWFYTASTGVFKADDSAAHAAY